MTEEKYKEISELTSRIEKTQSEIYTIEWILKNRIVSCEVTANYFGGIGYRRQKTYNINHHNNDALKELLNNELCKLKESLAEMEDQFAKI